MTKTNLIESLEESRERAVELLEKMKKIESRTQFHSEKFKGNTVVNCKREDNIERYRKLF